MLVLNKQTVSFDQWLEKLKEQAIADGFDHEETEDFNNTTLWTMYNDGCDIHEALIDYRKLYQL